MKKVAQKICKEVIKDLLNRYNNIDYWDDQLIDTLVTKAIITKYSPDKNYEKYEEKYKELSELVYHLLGKVKVEVKFRR